MVSKDRQNTTDSPIQVGEIDTRAPFQSVKDAVNLFGEGAFSGEKPAIKKIKPQSAEVCHNSTCFIIFFFLCLIITITCCQPQLFKA